MQDLLRPVSGPTRNRAPNRGESPKLSKNFGPKFSFFLYFLFHLFTHFLSHRYQGYIPTVNHMFGETFGNATEKYFLDYRSRTLASSASPRTKVRKFHNFQSLNFLMFSFSMPDPQQGGSPILEFPKIYTDPRLVVGTRDRTTERWRSPPTYKTLNYSHDLSNRNQDIQKMNRVCDV